MKFRSFIWISAVALVILMLVQYYFITETFQTKQAQFDSKYKSLSKLGIYEFENQYIDQVQDSIFTLLDDFAYFSIHDLGFATLPIQKDSLRRNIYEEFWNQLSQSKIRESYLEVYFKEVGEPSLFRTEYRIYDITLLSFNEEIKIFPDSGFFSEQNLAPDSYLINNYTIERNFYKIKYGYFISFTTRSEQIAREMRLTKTLSFATLFIVFTVFFLTLRNLFIQKRLSELKTDFINNMTHELKTPLSTISVATSNLARKDGDIDREQVKEISEIIKKQNKHLTKLIERILDISIWEKDQVRIHRKPLKINDFIKEITNSFITGNPNIDLNLFIDLEDQDKTVLLDEVHFTTVINNLLSNALKYGGDSEDKHRITVRVESDKNLIIKVEDNGKGIPREEQSQIFEKFFRGKKSKKNVIKGLGLGLYYVRQIVAAHNGKAFLENSSAKGSVFVIEIPEEDENITR